MPSATTLLGELTWEVEPHAYQRLVVPPDPPLDPLLEILARRSLVPSITNTLLDVFPDRPMERALIAYDLATGSLLGSNDGALVQRIVKELAPLRQLGPLAPVAIPRDRVSALVDVVRPSLDTAGDVTSLPSLAALAQAGRLEDDSPIVEHVLAHVKQLSKAHLPSLAVGFLQILWTSSALPSVLELLIELALEHDMLHVLPESMGQDDRSMQLQTYLFVRAHLANFDTYTPKRALEALDAQVGERDAKDSRIIVARAELAILEHEPVADAVVAIIGELGQPVHGWRYACRVRDAIAMRADPSRTADIVDGYVTMFGNNSYLWAHARDDDDVRAQLLPLLSRELRYASHDLHLWRAVSIFVADGEPIGMEIDQRMQAQLERVFG